MSVLARTEDEERLRLPDGRWYAIPRQMSDLVICWCERCQIGGPIDYEMEGFDPGELNFYADTDGAVVCFSCVSPYNVTRIDNLPPDPNVPG